MCVCVCPCVRSFVRVHIIPYVNCFGRTVLYMCIEYYIWVNMYHVSAQGVDERMINVHYYYYLTDRVFLSVDRRTLFRILVNMPDPFRIRSGSAWKRGPEAGRLILAHQFASGPDLFGQNLDPFGQNLIQSAKTKSDQGWFCKT